MPRVMKGTGKTAILRSLSCAALVIGHPGIIGCTQGYRMKSDIPLYRNSREFEGAVVQRLPLGTHVSDVEQRMQRSGFRCFHDSVPVGAVDFPEHKPGQPRRKVLRCGRSRQGLFGNRVWVVLFDIDEGNIVTNVTAYTHVNRFP